MPPQGVPGWGMNHRCDPEIQEAAGAWVRRHILRSPTGVEWRDQQVLRRKLRTSATEPRVELRDGSSSQEQNRSSCQHARNFLPPPCFNPSMDLPVALMKEFKPLNRTLQGLTKLRLLLGVCPNTVHCLTTGPGCLRIAGSEMNHSWYLSSRSSQYRKGDGQASNNLHGVLVRVVRAVR